ncbi:hypothetical protein HPB47_020015 [Ixodes persulcatus]|uniref:Uncharacterized protein n=1 Tax=Ixodes persulcatus TaxID=34615 RepID=A0AC60QGL6_IXOPE|nr:hypothetical protein HPB47_020015 [Ixodes persulcatus]
MYGAAAVLQQVGTIRKWRFQDGGQQSLLDQVALGRGVEVPIHPDEGAVLTDDAPSGDSTAGHSIAHFVSTPTGKAKIQLGPNFSCTHQGVCYCRGYS